MYKLRFSRQPDKNRTKLENWRYFMWIFTYKWKLLFSYNYLFC